jgi:hypothetical protein
MNHDNHWTITGRETRTMTISNSNQKFSHRRQIQVKPKTNDEFNLHWGARILHSKLKMRVRHFYEEFDDGHMNISYRYDVALPKIYSVLS